ncbi:MAG: isoaspartyl peptidase/L-asparaginase [Flavobacteriales bacterium]
MAQTQPYGIVIHGGAGYITPDRYSPEEIEAFESKLSEALNAGYSILENNGTSEEAVIAAIKILEDSPLFNAGKGSVLNHDGHVEMDASIMRGNDLKAGAVASITQIKNPILAAQAVMNKSHHVMLCGIGADEFGKTMGLTIEKPAYFITEDKKQALNKALESERTELDHGHGQVSPKSQDYKYGTVGAVALDKNGNLCAGTSTGGMTNKRHNRVGDSPIIGAGTYANNETCAISCTGHGEYFIRLSVAHEINSLMKYEGLSLEEAANQVVQIELKDMGGDGGLIGIDSDGNITTSFNTSGMFRGFRTNKLEAKILIFK